MKSINKYYIARGDDGFFYIEGSKSSYADGPGDFQSLGDNSIGTFNTRKEAEEYLDNAPVKKQGSQGYTKLIFKFD